MARVTRAKLQHRSMKPTLVQYDAPGWGVGEIWLDEDGRVFHCELPAPAAPEPRAARLGRRSRVAARVQAFFAGEADDFPTCRSASPDGFYGDCARALRAVPRGEVVTYGELAALAGYPGAARAAGTFCARCAARAVRARAPRRRPNGIGSLRRRSASSTSGACWRSKVSLCALRRPPRRAGADRAARGAAAGSPSSRRSSTPSGAWHLRGGERRRPPRPRRARRPRAARSRCCATSACGRRSAPTGGARSTGRRATSCTSRSTQRALDVLREAGVLSASRRAARACRRSASSAARAAAAPICAARCSAPARSRARATRTSSCARASIDGARFIADVAAREGVRSRVAERRNHAVAYAKGHETIADLLALAGAGDTALRLEEHAVVAATRAERQPPRERRRGEPRAHRARRARAARGDPRARRRQPAGASSPRSPSCGCATRRRRCASSRPRCGRRSRRRRPTAGCDAVVAAAPSRT